MDLGSLPDEVKELVRTQIEQGRFQSVAEVVCEAFKSAKSTSPLIVIAEGVAAEERGELRDGVEAIAAVRRRIDERLCRA